jgi:hypothetical protein
MCAYSSSWWRIISCTPRSLQDNCCAVAAGCAAADSLQVLPILTDFVDTARSGALSAATRASYPWLEPISGMDDPIKGGFYMAADYVKYSMPIATSMTVLALSLVSGYSIRPAACVFRACLLLRRICSVCGLCTLVVLHHTCCICHAL